MTSEKTAIERACEIVGGQSALARILGLKPQSVQKWVNKNEVPAKRVVAIERATNGQVKRYDLCPELYEKAVA